MFKSQFNYRYTHTHAASERERDLKRPSFFPVGFPHRSTERRYSPSSLETSESLGELTSGDHRSSSLWGLGATDTLGVNTPIRLKRLEIFSQWNSSPEQCNDHVRFSNRDRYPSRTSLTRRALLPPNQKKSGHLRNESSMNEPNRNLSSSFALLAASRFSSQIEPSPRMRSLLEEIVIFLL